MWRRKQKPLRQEFIDARFALERQLEILRAAPQISPDNQALIATFEAKLRQKQETLDKLDADVARTALAIVAAAIAMTLFYYVNRVLFDFVVAAYKFYDPSFVAGIGAIVFMGLGTNTLGTIFGVAVTKRIFPRASSRGVYYGLSTIIIISGLTFLEQKATSSDGKLAIAWINFAIIAVTIYALKLFLRPSETRFLSDG
jgi:hypothetical protein